MTEHTGQHKVPDMPERLKYGEVVTMHIVGDSRTFWGKLTLWEQEGVTLRTTYGYKLVFVPWHSIQYIEQGGDKQT